MGIDYRFTKNQNPNYYFVQGKLPNSYFMYMQNIELKQPLTMFGVQLKAIFI